MKLAERQGFTLVEIILAITLLGIVVVLLLPVVFSAYNQIVTNGNRTMILKSVDSLVEQVLAGGSRDNVEESTSILLPYGSVSVNKYSKAMTSKTGPIDIFYYIAQEMDIAQPPDIDPENPNDDDHILSNITISTNDWTLTAPYITIQHIPTTVSATMPLGYKLYRIVDIDEENVDSEFIVAGFITSSTDQTLTISDNSENYTLIFCGSTINNTKPIDIIAAPQNVSFIQSSKTFVLSDSNIPLYEIGPQTYRYREVKDKAIWDEYDDKDKLNSNNGYYIQVSTSVGNMFSLPGIAPNG